MIKTETSKSCETESLAHVNCSVLFSDAATLGICARLSVDDTHLYWSGCYRRGNPSTWWVQSERTHVERVVVFVPLVLHLTVDILRLPPTPPGNSVLRSIRLLLLPVSEEGGALPGRSL